MRSLTNYDMAVIQVYAALTANYKVYPYSPAENMKEAITQVNQLLDKLDEQLKKDYKKE